jgi:hypothetical protein
LADTQVSVALLPLGTVLGLALNVTVGAALTVTSFVANEEPPGPTQVSV